MKYSLVVDDAQRDLLRHLPPLLKQKVWHALEEIVANPSAGNPLVEELVGLRSYRIGKLRLIYRVEPHAVPLIAFGPRPTIYQQVALELRRQAHPRSE